MKVGILGSGSWGTALAQVLADNDQEVLIWGKNVDEVVDIDLYHQNSKYFNDLTINPKIKATTDIQRLVGSDVVIIATPSHTIAAMCGLLNQTLKQPTIIINVAKGINEVTLETPLIYMQAHLKPAIARGLVSLIGPSHAEEVIKRLQTVITAVSADEELAIEIQHLFANEYFRVYRTDDIIGAEIGAALKNVIAIASGILTGIGLGDNARAALITRGLNEMKLFGVALGGREETFSGLTGLGDLIVTCTSKNSRNFQAGYLIGKHNSASVFWNNNTATVEGVKATKTIFEMSKKMNLTMPITEQVFNVLYQNQIPSDAVNRLMLRRLKEE